LSDYDRVYDYIRAIPAGSVSSYGEIGAATNASAREVGRALRMAPADVPWQRVVGAGGDLLVGKLDPVHAQVQRAMLEAEGVTFDKSRRVERRFFIGAEPELDL